MSVRCSASGCLCQPCQYSRAVAIVVSSFIIWTSAVGCGQPSAAVPSLESETQPISVKIVTPQRQTVRRTIEQPGYIQAYEQTPMFARIPGYVDKVHVEIGTLVRKGDVLAELAVPELFEEVKQKEAQVQQVEKELEVCKARVTTATALVEEAKAGVPRAEANSKRWQLENDRIADLTKREVLNQQTALETWNQWQAAMSAVKEAAARVQSARAAQKEAETKRDKAEVDVRVVQADHRRMVALASYAQLKAPFDGVVMERHVDTGHFVQPPASGNDGKSKPLFVVVRTDLVRIFVDVPEADAVMVNKGCPARIRIDGLNDQEVTGEVTGVSWALEPNQRTLRAEIDFANPEGKLRPGMYANANLTVNHENLLTLPSTAVLTRDNQAFCYRLDGGKAVRTPLKTGIRQDGVVQVLKKQIQRSTAGASGTWEDITGQEQIIASSPGSLTDGQQVRPSLENK